MDQPPRGRPRHYYRNARPPPRPQVRDDDHVAKLKLTVPPFDGKYNPDAYLTWELEVEQRFACLNSLILLPYGGLNIVAYIMIIYQLLRML